MKTPKTTLSIITSKVIALAAGSLMFWFAGAAFANTYMTFQVNMSVASTNGAFNVGQIYVNSSDNDWGGTGWQLTNNPSASNPYLYTGTFNDTTGTNGNIIQYKFYCTSLGWEANSANSSSGNRLALLPATNGASLVLPVAYYSDDGPAVTNNVVFQVDMAQQVHLGTFIPGTSAVDAYGSFGGWGTSPLLLTNNPAILRTNQYGLVTSNVYVGTAAVVSSFGALQEFKYVINGSDFESPAVGDPGNNNNRLFANAPQTLPVVFFSDAPYAPVATNAVLFQVDMTAQLYDGSFVPSQDQVWVEGSFNGWSTGNQSGNQCTNNPNAANPNLYSTVVVITDDVGATEQYKFTYTGANVPGGIDWEYPASTTPTMGSASNRYFLQPNATSMVLPAVYFSDQLPATPANQFGYTTNNGTITITGYRGTNTAVTIPSTINWYPVTSIGKDAFFDWTSLTSVTIPNSVTSIGDWAFSYCLGLTSVTIPNSVTNIGEEAFYYCLGLTSVIIGTNVSSIGDYAFYDCNYLTSVTIPNSVTSIGDWAFYSCESLTNVTIGTSVTSIGDDAFYNCWSLTSVTIPNSVTSIGDWAFYDCVGLTSVTIPNSVTNIGEEGFCYCLGLTSVIIGTNVSSIGDYAFYDCTSLTSVYFQGNAPNVGGPDIFSGDNNAIIYCVAGTAGWGSIIENDMFEVPIRFGFNFTGTSNLVVVVNACTNLANPNWIPVATNTLTGGSFYFSDPQWTNYPCRFYRLSTTNIPVTTPAGMALIPAGSFTMGDTLDGGWPDYDNSPTNVYVSAFYMDTNLVSYGQWQTVYNWATNHEYAFDHAGSAQTINQSVQPVQTVDWYDAVKWSNARSQQAGLTPVYYTDAGFTQVFTNGDNGTTVYANWTATGYRLPTEAEWEKAARGGLSGQRFPWGDTISESQANYYAEPADYSFDLGPYNGSNTNFDTGGYPYTSPVGYFAPNGYGLYDMAGNVGEWCWDWYGTPYGQPTTTNPTGPTTGSNRVLRGGDWGDNANFARCAFRPNSNPVNALNQFGFRCVRGL